MGSGPSQSRLRRISRLDLAFCSFALSLWLGTVCPPSPPPVCPPFATHKANNEGRANWHLATVVLRRRLRGACTQVGPRRPGSGHGTNSRWLRCCIHFGLEANAAWTWSRLVEVEKRYIKYAPSVFPSSKLSPRLSSPSLQPSSCAHLPVFKPSSRLSCSTH